MVLQSTINVCVTGAAGQIVYSLLFNLSNGEIFGKTQPIRLFLLDIQPAMETLKGVVMELEDCALPLLSDVIVTTDPMVAFQDCDVAILVGAMPRKGGMQRKDLLKANAAIFKTQGEALDKVAKKSVKILVVGNPANTNALLAKHYAPSIPAKNFSALTRLDENRAKSQISIKLGIKNVSNVRNVIVWGNHSNTQYPDVSHATVFKQDKWESVKDLISDNNYIEHDFLKTVQNRGAAVIAARKMSSAMSASKAICDHIRSWWQGTLEGEFVSMAVWSDGSYGVAKDIIYSFPCVCKNGNWEIVQGLAISPFSQAKMTASAEELLGEKQEALDFLARAK